MSSPSTSSDSTRNASRRGVNSTRAEPELLAQVGLFADLSTEELVGLAALMRPRPYAKDEVIYLRGDPGTAFYVIATGKVKIALTSPAKNSKRSPPACSKSEKSPLVMA